MSEPVRNVERFLSMNQRGTLNKCLKAVVLAAGGRKLGANGIKFLQKLMAIFEEKELPINKAYLVGGFATYLMNTNYRYNDYDIVMPVELEKCEMEEMTFAMILDSFKELIRRSLQESDAQDSEENPDQFIAKKFRFNRRNGSTDSWSLISLKAEDGINLELKFVLSLARKYEFVTDSLAVDLMPLLNGSDEPMSYRLYCDGDTNQNVNIIRRLKIKILNPEQISGGGFLKYCRLKSEGLQYYARNANEATIIPPMARGFFIRYGDNVAAIKDEIEKYLAEHFKTVGNITKNNILEEILTATNSNDVPKKQHCGFDQPMTIGSLVQNKTAVIQKQIAGCLTEHFQTVGKHAKRRFLEEILSSISSVNTPRPMASGSHAQYGIDAPGIKNEIENYLAELYKIVIKEAKTKFLEEIKTASKSIEVSENQHILKSAVNKILADFESDVICANP